jgi:hypothetical protein
VFDRAPRWCKAWLFVLEGCDMDFAIDEWFSHATKGHMEPDSLMFEQRTSRFAGVLYIGGNCVSKLGLEVRRLMHCERYL